MANPYLDAMSGNKQEQTPNQEAMDLNQPPKDEGDSNGCTCPNCGCKLRVTMDEAAYGKKNENMAPKVSLPSAGQKPSLADRFSGAM